MYMYVRVLAKEEDVEGYVLRHMSLLNRRVCTPDPKFFANINFCFTLLTLQITNLSLFKNTFNDTKCCSKSGTDLQIISHFR